jgi:hypothetical protein
MLGVSSVSGLVQTFQAHQEQQLLLLRTIITDVEELCQHVIDPLSEFAEDID